MDEESRAQAIVGGEDASACQLRELAGALRDAGRTGLVAEMLTAVARRALDGRWRPAERAELASKVLRDHQQFNYARRLLSRVRTPDADSELLRQQHALCTYKDLELPAGRRLDWALTILEQGGPLEQSISAETLGIAGAIYKRRWEVDAKRVDLENALWCYQRGFDQKDHPERWYAGVNAAFVADRLAALEDQALGVSREAEALREKADQIRTLIAKDLEGGDRGWNDATRGEALFGLRRFDEACKPLAAVASNRKELWRQETTAMQLAALAQLRDVADDPGAVNALRALVGGHAGAVRRASIGKVGVALSGGGFRASLFHIGVLARLAECNVLRRVEVLSCVSGGSILGAFYYLKLRRLLQRKTDEDVTDGDYVALVHEVADEFLAGVRENLRRRLGTDLPTDVKMLFTPYSRTDRAGELFEELFYGPLRDEDGAWRMPDLIIKPAGRGENFSLRYENWLRAAKVPILVLNATTLNTGHSWQFTASWMGEPPVATDARVDASQRLRRVYYRDTPDVEELRRPTLGTAVAASACVPGIFPPITLTRLYDGIDVELVDGGVHDNQGIASLVEQDCNVILVSDASGQLRDDQDPKRGLMKVSRRSNSILMKRVRGAQYGELLGRHRSGTLRGLMAIHLTKGLRAPPRDWSKCQERWTPEDDALPGASVAPYGLDPTAQRMMAELRTDLDAFSDDEAYALMAAGYLITKNDLGDALPDLAQADETLELGDQWPFWDILAEMTSQDASRLADSLRGGSDLFFRGPKAQLRRLRGLAPKLPSPERRKKR
ncbi:MAG TPA: tetratricopeptide repeat-containing protein [Solirubrobacteraceae bacterium]